ncbi:MAG: hypothetical protein E6G90_16900 [Alphaproteobacteria bacterium]|nr:MAG: hypothetical protein E6G90_16900 [Alphaproteobacteria bacterium]
MSRGPAADVRCSCCTTTAGVPSGSTFTTRWRVAST